MQYPIFARKKKKVSWPPKNCLIFKCFVLGIITDSTAIRLWGRSNKTAQNHVSRGNWEAGSCAEEPSSGREVGNMAGDGTQVRPVSFLLSITLLNHPSSFGAPPAKAGTQVTGPTFAT